MKTIKQFLVATLIVGASSGAYAQQSSDSTRQNQSPTSPSQNQQSQSQGTQGTQGSQSQPGNQFNSSDYTTMQSSDIPASLRTTLQGKNYKGWESGKVYRHNNGNGYYISTGTGSNAKSYYFDKSGKETKGPGSTGANGPGVGKSPQPK